MQPSTDLYQRLKNLSTPEDIQKWIMERKKRYPTKVNIELRKAEEMEKTKRGEIIKQTQDVLKRRNKKSSNVQDRKRNVQRRPDRKFNNMPQQTVEIYRGVTAFTGTLHLREMDPQKVNSNENSIEEIDEKTVNYISDEEDISAAPLNFCNATSCLPTLVANYGSDSEESDGPEDVPIKKEKITDGQVSNIVEETKAFISAVEKQPTNNALFSKQPPMSHSVSEHTDTKRQKKQDIEKSQHLQGKDSRTTVNRKRPQKLQLLERLLSRSIQYERNLICQCIKYVVDNNFFD